jgi:folate-dependent phosphoribosylglycinamide formyltransferase PurN
MGGLFTLCRTIWQAKERPGDIESQVVAPIVQESSMTGSNRDRGASPIRVVLFTGGAVLEREVIAFLERLDNDPDIEVVGVFAQASVTGVTGILRDLWTRRGLLAIPLATTRLLNAASRWLFSPISSWRRRRLLSRLEQHIRFVDVIHNSDVLQNIRDLAPDLGLVYGGPIIKPDLFLLPRYGTLGIHHGKVPEYRGKKTTFWAMFNGEAEVAVIIQQIGDRLDSGDIIAQGTVATGKKPIMVVKRELERMGIDIYMRAIHGIKSGTATRTTQRMETKVLYKDPGIKDILEFWRRYIVRLFQ